MFCYVLGATRYHAGSLFSQKMPWHISQHPQRALQQTAGRYWEQTPTPAIAPGGRKRYSASYVLDMVLYYVVLHDLASHPVQGREA